MGAVARFVEYEGIDAPVLVQAYLQVRFSKHSPATVPVEVHIDGGHRALFVPADQGSWDAFAWTEPVSLGTVLAGSHTLTLETEGQQSGVAD